MTEPQTPFAGMVTRIEANAPQDFNGALVVVPPEGEPISMLLIGPVKDTAQFWASVKTKIDIAVQDFQEQARRQQVGWR